MRIYYGVLFVFYLIFTILIALFIAWNIFKTKKITEKIIGAIALLMFLIRILMIRQEVNDEEN